MHVGLRSREKKNTTITHVRPRVVHQPAGAYRIRVSSKAGRQNAKNCLWKYDRRTRTRPVHPFSPRRKRQNVSITIRIRVNDNVTYSSLRLGFSFVFFFRFPLRTKVGTSYFCEYFSILVANRDIASSWVRYFYSGGDGGPPETFSEVPMPRMKFLRLNYGHCTLLSLSERSYTRRSRVIVVYFVLKTKLTKRHN